SITYSNSPSWSGATESQPGRIIKWAGNSGGSAYGGTWHEALSGASRITFGFTGTAVSVVGIVGKIVHDTELGVSLDGGAETIYAHAGIPDSRSSDLPDAYTPEDFMYGVQVFSASNLSPSSHTLVLTGHLQGFTFGLDYIEYTPVDIAAATSQITTGGAQTTGSQSSGTTQQTASSLSSSSSTGTQSAATNSLSGLTGITISSGVTADLPTIFPSDSRIVYTSQHWTPGISCGLNSVITAELGAGWTFNFTGPEIWIYTATSQQGGKYTVTIDGNNLGVIDTVGSNCKIEASYHVGNLDNYAHSISLTSTGTSASSTGEINFVGLRLSPSVDQATGAQFEAGVNKAAIAGGVIGGIAVLTLLIAGIYLCLRRQRREEFLKSAQVIEAIDSIAPIILPTSASNIALTEKQRLAASNANTRTSNQPMMYQSQTKPPIPYWALTVSHEGSAENVNSHQTEPGSSMQHQQRVPLHSLPPSFRTRPFSGPNNRAQDAHSLYSTTSLGFSNESPQIFNPSAEGGAPDVVDDEWSSAPPYVEDVLARPDARNLSENDVDTIARRLAEVMRVQNAARGGPGLLPHNERTAPPRELIDQLVEEHLGARE
ncbi:hypothetical protein M408DRAFT_50643, partial [Serendipita vermifera MAFF 305830]